MIRILFVCLGNICRSAAAEEIMRCYIRREGLDNVIQVDSAGISGYHQGDEADPRMRAHAARRGYTITHRSRPVCLNDFEAFDMILAMDDSNFDALKAKAPDVESEHKIVRMTDFCRVKQVDHVPDPY